MSFEMLLGLGTALMIMVTLLTGAKYKYPIWKRIVLAIALTIFGVIGTKIMAFIEMGNFKGRSFFGAVFFTPMIMIPIGLLLKVKPLDTTDLCAPAECAMSVLMKINCIIADCCIGRVMYISKYGKQMRFPSQIVECIAAFIIMVGLIILLSTKKQRGLIYPWYMIIYGVVRFILNLFRETTPFVWILPAGNFWALISVVIGAILIVANRVHTNRFAAMYNVEQKGGN